MENESKKPNAGAAGGADASSDAAAMSARLLALQENEDDYTYTNPPAPKAPLVAPRGSRKGRFVYVLLTIVLFFVGAYAGKKLEQRKKVKPVATINGEEITPDEFAHISEIAAGRQALPQIINDKLVLQFARKKGLMPDQVTIDSKFEKAKRSPDFFKQLRMANQTEADYKLALLIQLCNQAIIYQGVKASPQEAQEYYRKNVDPSNAQARFFHPENVVVAVVVTKEESEIRKADAELKKGTNFQTVVAKYSKDVSRTRGGVLQPIKKGSIKTAAYQSLDKVLFDMQPGSQCEPRLVAGFWWIIRCLQHNPEKTDTFDSVQEDCNTAVLLMKGVQKNGEALKKEEEEFVKKSNIDILNPQYQDLTPRPN